MIHVIIGNGRGKTSSAVGLAIRSAGHGFPVLFMQFIKDDSSGEIAILRNVPHVTICHPIVNYGFTFQMTEEQLKETAIEYEKMVDEAIKSDAFMIVLDESIHALKAGLIKKEKLEKLLENHCEFVLTGYEAPEWLISKADYVSYIKKIKHPYDLGIEARPGIEY